ncbi:MAG TPA: hypothetical protein V6C69_11760 [Trichormus sp.]
MRFWCARWLPTILVIALNLASEASTAQTAAGLADKLHASGAVAADAAINVLTLPDETIVIVESANVDEQSLRKMASDIARAANEDPVARTRALKIVGCDQFHKTKSLTLTADQLATTGAADRATVSSGEQALSAKAASPVATQGVGSGDYPTKRKRLVERIKWLESKGVGVKPFFDQLSRIDGLYSHGDSTTASTAMAHLVSTVSEHEQIIKQKSLTAARPVTAAAPQMSSAKQAAMQQMLAEMKAKGASQKQINDALADFQGTSDAYYDEIARTMLQHELGDLAPCEGPFRMERFRIAKKIQELRNSGAKTAGFVSYYRKLEDEAAEAQKDPRRLAEMADNIRYMNKQLGLSELQGGSHRHQ